MTNQERRAIRRLVSDALLRRRQDLIVRGCIRVCGGCQRSLDLDGYTLGCSACTDRLWDRSDKRKASKAAYDIHYRERRRANERARRARVKAQGNSTNLSGVRGEVQLG